MADIKSLAEIVGRPIKTVEEDLRLIAYFRDNLPEAINRLFVKGPGWLHEPLAPFQEEGVRLAAYGPDRCYIIWPRGHAKTTIIPRALTALMVALGVHRKVAVLSYGEDNYKSNQDAMYHIFTGSRFSAVQWFLPYFYTGGQVRRSGDRIILGNNEGVIHFRSVIGEMRGMNDAEAGGRPTLIVPDDIIPTKAQSSQAVRDTVLKTFTSVVDPLGEEGARIVGVGTIMHPDDLVARIANGAFRYQTTPPEQRSIIRPNGDILWPSRWSVEEIEAKKTDYEREGLLGLFYCEYMNQPRMVESYPLAGMPTKRYSLESVNPWDMHRVIGVDHAHGTGGDYFVAIEYGMDWKENVFCLDMQRSNIWNIHTRIRKVVEMVQRRRPHFLVVEDTSESRTFIELLEVALQEAEISIEVVRVKPSVRGAKNDHILGHCEVLLRDGRLHFLVDTDHGQIFDNEANSFDYRNKDNTDDVLDTTATANRYLKPGQKPKTATSNLESLIEQTRSQHQQSNNNAYI